MFIRKTYDTSTTSVHINKEQAESILEEYITACELDGTLPTKYGLLQELNMTEDEYRLFLFEDTDFQIEQLGYLKWVKRFMQNTIIRLKTIWYKEMVKSKSNALIQLYNEQFSDVERVFNNKLKITKPNEISSWGDLINKVQQPVKTLGKGKKS